MNPRRTTLSKFRTRVRVLAATRALRMRMRKPPVMAGKQLAVVALEQAVALPLAVVMVDPAKQAIRNIQARAARVQIVAAPAAPMLQDNLPPEAVGPTLSGTHDWAIS